MFELISWSVLTVAMFFIWLYFCLKRLGNNQAAPSSSVIPSELNSEVCWKVNFRDSSWPSVNDVKNESVK